MKKVFKRSVALFLILIMLLTVGTVAASAASYPLIMYDRDESTPTIIKNQAGYLHFTIFTEYKNEKYTVEIYDKNDNLCASASDTYYNTTYMKEVTITVNTKSLDLDVGEYKVVYYVGYYTFFEWREAPNKYTTTLKIVSNKCNGKHNSKVSYSFDGSCSYKGYDEYTCKKCGHITYKETDYCHELVLKDGKLCCSECDYIEKKATLFKVNGVLSYFKNGVFKKATGFIKHSDGNKYYVVDGKVKKTTGLVKYKGKTYYLKSGKLYTKPTLVKEKGVWYYYNKGVKDKSDTLVLFQGKWYHVKGGKRVYDNTLVKYNGKLYYVKKGVKNTANTLVKYKSKLYHVKGGKWVKDTSIVKYNGKRYYVKSGIVQKVTKTVKVSGKWYKVKKGIVV